jgi:hypothetical protein
MLNNGRPVRQLGRLRGLGTDFVDGSAHPLDVNYRGTQPLGLGDGIQCLVDPTPVQIDVGKSHMGQRIAGARACRLPVGSYGSAAFAILGVRICPAQTFQVFGTPGAQNDKKPGGKNQ